MDDADIFIKNHRLSLEAESMSSLNTNNERILEYSYWKSPEALKLLNPRNNDGILICLSRRIEVISLASYDDDTLLTLLPNVKDINEISSFQRQMLRQQCLYLYKSYEIAVQRINTSTWEECINLAIKELADCGNVSIKIIERFSLSTYNFV